MGKTLYDKAGIFPRQALRDLLRDGIGRGFVSRQQRNGWP
jgi:hypothetical protein